MKSASKYLIISIFLVCFLYPFGYFIYVYKESYSILKSESQFKPGLSTTVYDVNGEKISELFDENRSYAKFKEIPDFVTKAFIAAEDKNFYSHTGVDIFGIFRAIIIDLFAGRIKQGGSTITQQLIKQLYTKREKTIKRKITELLIAMEFERRYSKEKILEMYLNQIYFGHGVYGIKSAAKFYFNRDLSRLGIIEASILAGIPSAPNRYSPLINPERAFKRNKNIIYSMIYAGFISKSDAAEKFNKFWKVYLDDIKMRYPALGVRNIKNDKAPYFTEYIRRILVKQYGEKKVYRGGLNIHTSLDLRHQRIARRLLSKAIEKQNRIAADYNRYRLRKVDYLITRKNIKSGKWDRKRFREKQKFMRTLRSVILDELMLGADLLGNNRIKIISESHAEEIEKTRKSSAVEGAFISIEPSSGQITSMVGGSNINSANQLNRAVQSIRQPGSAFKAFIYGAGIESEKVTLGSPFNDIPLFFKGRRKDKDWAPSNYGNKFQGRVLTRRAFAISLNIVSVLIYQMIGGRRIADFTSKILDLPKSRLEIDPTIALGTTELSPLEMARGFAVIANRGMSVKPISILHILDSSGKKIYDHRSSRKRRKRILSKETAFLMTSMMKSVVDSGTARGAIRNEAGFRHQAAGKTGTNTDFRDAWFVGFTPDLVAAVWLGCDSQKFTLRPGQSGSVASAPVWGRFMKEVYEFRKRTWFKRPPPGIGSRLICRITGNLKVKGCPKRREYFIKGTEPEEECDSEHSDIVNVFGHASKKRPKLLENMKNMFKLEDKDKSVENDFVEIEKEDKIIKE